MQAVGGGLAIHTAALGETLGNFDIRANRGIPGTTDISHHALDTSFALVAGQLVFVGLDLTNVAHRALVIRVAQQDLLKQRHSAIVILDHVPLPGLIIGLINIGLFFDGDCLARSWHGQGAKFLQASQAPIEGLSPAVVRGAGQGAIYQSACISQSFTILDQATGAKIASLSQAPRNLFAHGDILRTLRQEN